MKTLLPRLPICVAIVAATLWFGMGFGPLSKPPEGHCEIYRLIPYLISTLESYPSEVPGARPLRLLTINTNPVRYSIARTADTIADLFEYYSRVYAPSLPAPPSDITPDDLESMTDEELERREDDFITTHFLYPVLWKIERPTWGILAMLDQRGGGNLRELLHKREEKLTTAKGSLYLPLAGARIVMAFKTSPEGSTVFVQTEFDESFDFGRLIGNGSADLPGKDVPLVPRYPGSKRLYTIEEEWQGGASMVVIYSAKGAPEEQLDFFSASMPGYGWEANAAPERAFVPDVSAPPGVLHFSAPGRQCTIHSSRNGDSSETFTVTSSRSF